MKWTWAIFISWMLFFFTGCTSTLEGNSKLGFGVRQDYYVFQETQKADETQVAKATIDVQALVDYIVDLKANKEEDDAGTSSP